MQEPGFAAYRSDVGAARRTNLRRYGESSTLQDGVQMAVRRLYEADFCR